MTIPASPGAPGRPGPVDRHLDAGAYALGGLDESDTAAFERHLAVCGRCSIRLAEFVEVVPVLAELRGTGAPAPPGGGPPERPPARAVAPADRRRRGRRLAVAVAAALIAAGPPAVVLATGRSAPPAATSAVTVRHRGHDPATGVSATAGLTPQRWGTRIELTLSDIYGPRDCRLVVVGRDGRRETAASWTVPAGGYGTDEGAGPLVVTGSTALPPSAVARLDVLTARGQRLVSVPG